MIVASTTPLPVSGQQAVNQSGRYTTEHPVEPMAKRAKTEDSQETLPQETSRKQFGNYANYSEEERDTILNALQTSEWFADAVKSLKKKMVHFTLTKRKLQYRLHRNTLMNWFRRPELGLRAQRLLTSTPAEIAFTRKPSWNSSLGGMSVERREHIVEAVKSGDSSVLAAAATTDGCQAPAVPAQTLHRWLRASIFRPALEPEAFQLVHDTWAKEYEFNFGVLKTVPEMRISPVSAGGYFRLLWGA